MSVLKPDQALEEIRREIDGIDDAILDLLARRFAATAQVKAAKSNDGSIAASPLRPAREASLLRRLLARSQGRLPPELLVRLWRVILSTSTLAQAPVTIHAAEEPAADLNLRLLLERHFCGMEVRAHGGAADALAALEASRGDLAVLKADASWPTSFTALAASGLRVIGSLPALARRSPPQYLVFGYSQSMPTGNDETLLLCRDGAPPPPGTPRWSTRSGPWRMTAVSGYLEGDAALPPSHSIAGRYPCPLEVLP